MSEVSHPETNGNGYHDENSSDRRRLEKQFTVTGRIKPTKLGTEAIRFSFRLGPIRVTCIANVPGDGEEEAPVYVRLGLVF